MFHLRAFSLSRFFILSPLACALALFHSFTTSLFHFFTFHFSLFTFHCNCDPNHGERKFPPFWCAIA